MDPYKAIKYPLSTEKSIKLMESENKMIFVIDNNATKQDVKKAVEKLFKAKAVQINTFVTSNCEKRAYVKFSQETPAIDIATQMGLM